VNKQIRRLGMALVVCYVALFAMLNYWQVIGADQLNDHPRNTRAIVRDFNALRGTISTADGTLLAESVEIEGGQFELQRRYLEPELYAGVTGYYSFGLGATGVEKEYNAELSGRTFDLQLRSLGDLFIDRDHVGDVVLTLRNDVQTVARDALGSLGDVEGSVVALDPRTGAILALWSNPSYDPNLISSHDTEAAIAVKTALEAEPSKPMVAHTFQDRYFPGSTFKIITATAGLETGVTPDSPVFPSVRSYTPPQTDRPINNFGGGSLCGGALFEILARSCNAAFAQMAVEAGPDAMIAAAEAYGFNDTPPIDLPGAIESIYPTDFDQNIPALAQSGIGQNDVQATPLEMALVAGAVGNGGSMMAPHVMLEVRDSEGGVVDEADAEEWKSPIDEAQAAILREAMLGVVADGTATRLAVDGFEVGGKTGTAQTGIEGSGDHAWIIGFAGPPGEPAHVAVAVFIKARPGQDEQTGGVVAAPIAQQVLSAALALSG
jgi:peptidoglycan glycosyltransferase